MESERTRLLKEQLVALLRRYGYEDRVLVLSGGHILVIRKEEKDD